MTKNKFRKLLLELLLDYQNDISAPIGMNPGDLIKKINLYDFYIWLLKNKDLDSLKGDTEGSKDD